MTFICHHMTDNPPIKWQGSAWVLYKNLTIFLLIGFKSDTSHTFGGSDIPLEQEEQEQEDLMLSSELLKCLEITDEGD